jgi:hypothetical protein
VYHSVGDAVTLCAKGGGILSKNVEKLGIFHWNADGSGLDGTTLGYVALKLNLKNYPPPGTTYLSHISLRAHARRCPS